MSILDNLLAGHLDAQGAQLLYATVSKIGRGRNFPPPTGFRAWNQDAVITTAHDFLTSTRAVERLVQIAATAYDDESLTRLLETAVLNFLRDQARQTVIGTQIRRLKTILAADDTFVINGETVGLTGGPAEPYAADEAVLVRAARRVDAGTRRWRPDAKRQGPLATKEEMVALIVAVLTAAEARLTFASLARVIARRFDLDPLAATTEIDALDPTPQHSYDEVDVGDQAAHILDQLTDRERLVLPYLDMSTREAEQLLPLGRTTIANTQLRLKTLLADLLPHGDAGAAILRVLTRLITTAD
ncbi:hypothetical protein ACGFQG_19245 [Nocardia fluminea]|uniref:hypothetical protein n=1 Tax=Nocardia fluminea TaxID=134984 RepID=UPI0037216EFE